MKKVILLLCGIAMLFAFSCSETQPEVLPEPHPTTGDKPTKPATKLALSIKPAAPPTASLYSALITAVKEDGSPLYTDTNLALTLVDGMLVSNTMDLPAGKYKLTRLVVKDENKNVIMAIPQANSERATSSAKALPLAFTEAPLTVEVVNVNEADLPEEFGYPSTEFGERPYIKITAHSIIHIGNATYTPEAKIKITSGGWSKEIENGSEVLLPKKYSSYHFASTGWNITSTKEMSLQLMRLLPTVTLEGYAQPKRIKTEEVMTTTDAGGSIVKEKREYSYNENNQLKEIHYYQKKKDTDELELIMKRTFGYALNDIVTINEFAGDGSFIGYTLFWYDLTSRVLKIEETQYDKKTSATFTYHYDNKTEVTGNYTLSNGNTMIYKMKYLDGNKTEDIAFGNSSESGKYQFDSKINPFYVLHYPDLFLSNSSKNNKLAEEKNYGGNIPFLEVYKTEYSYDADGYPELVIKSYRGYTSKQHLFKDIIEYSYYE